MSKSKTLIAPLLGVSLLLAGCAGTAAETAEPVEDSPLQVAEELPPEIKPAALRIAEVMTSNDSYVVNGRVGDWVELLNEDTVPAMLGDYYLSKDPVLPLQNPLPEITLQPGERVLLSCGGELLFNLSKDGEELLLSCKTGAVVDAASIPAMGTDESWTMESGAGCVPTPGYAAGDPVPRPEGLFISEVFPLNSTLWADGTGAYGDAVELCNAGDRTLDLSGYYLSDDKHEPKKQALSGTLAPGACLMVSCREFGLSGDGETVYITKDDGAVADALAFEAVPVNLSYGRAPSGERGYFTFPTPGKGNGTVCGRCKAPVCSAASGFFDEAISVTLSGEGEIYYTTDGSAPGKSSKLYAGEEIPVKGVMSIRACCVKDGCVDSPVTTFCYFIQEPEYDLDVVKLSVSPGDKLAAFSDGYSTAEVAGNLSFFHEGKEEFSLPCGVSLFGSGSRVYQKHSYQIDFNGKYGASKLHYPLFDCLDLDSFDSLVLRSGSQDKNYCMLRDELLTSLWGGLCDTMMVSAYRPVQLYINEEYAGIYYIREHLDADMIASHDGVPADSVVIVKNINRSQTIGDVNNELGKLLRSIASADMSIEENYADASEKIDMDSLICFFAAEIWGYNYDLNNARMFRSDAHDGKWRFILYDMDVALLKDGSRSVETFSEAYGGLFRSLMQNEGFRERFMLFIGEAFRGAAADEAVLARLDAMVEYLDHDMAYNCERWAPTSTYGSYEDWQYWLDQMRSAEGIGITGCCDRITRQLLEHYPVSAETIEQAFGTEYLEYARP